MSTRSRIGIMNKDGTVKSVYCHFDGYLEGVGTLLDAYYNDLESANKIVALGDISSLSIRLEAPMGASHSFDHPMTGITVAYGRDRGEAEVDAAISGDLSEFLKLAINSGAEYVYLYDTETMQWLVSSVPYGDAKWNFEILKIALTKLFGTERTQKLNAIANKTAL